MKSIEDVLFLITSVLVILYIYVYILYLLDKHGCLYKNSNKNMRGDIYKTKGGNAYVLMTDSDAIIITDTETLPAVTFTIYRIGKVTQCMRQQLFYEQFEIVKDLSTIPAPVKTKK